MAAKPHNKRRAKKPLPQRSGGTPPRSDYAARITVVGVGGGGGNAISRMRERMTVRGIEFVAINTDAQDLEYCNARKKICIGKNLTRGLGAGMNPDLGRQAAEENRSEIVESLRGSDLVFVTAGFGGGTGSPASTVVAEAAKEIGALTVAVVTKPFAFEGEQRSRIADEWLGKLREKVDALIVVPNDRIFNIIKKDTPLIRAFECIDDVLREAVQGIADLIAMPGIINVDFSDVKAIMQDAGLSLIGVGIASGSERAVNAVTQAMNSPLLEVSIDGAKGILLGISGGRDLRMTEVNEAAKLVASAADPGAKIIFGAYHDRKLKAGQIKITLVATGFEGTAVKAQEQSSANLFSAAFAKEEAPEGKLAAAKSESISEKEKGKAPEKTFEDNPWEIPAFLRRKRK